MEIKEHAFNYTSSLTNVVNLDKVKKVGDYAFANSSIDNVVIGSDSVYGEGAFFRSTLTNVTIGDNAEFGLGAFQECKYLTTVNMPESNVKFGRGCFSYAVQLASIDLSHVVEINEEAFYGCSSLVRLLLNSAEKIGNYAFADCSKVMSIYIPKVKEIGEGAFARYDTFGGAPAISSITLPDTLTTIKDGAFLGCESLIEIVIPESVTHMGDYLFAYCVNLTSVVLPSNIKTVGLYSFAGCSLLEEINLENVEEFKDYAFASCVYLEDVDLSSAKKIGEAAFADTYVTGNFVMNDLEEVKMYAFQGANILSIYAPKLKTIGEAAFQNNKNLSSFTFSSDLESIDSLAFNGCESLQSFYTSEGLTNGEINNYAKLIDGILYIYLENGKLQLMSVPQDMDIHTLNVKEGTVRIDFFAGNENSHVQKIVLPDGLETIGNYAFKGYEKLKIVEFKSIKAPALESFWDANAVLGEEDPGFDTIHNQYDLFGLELCYYTFIDLVGKTEKIDMILPVNPELEGYDSLVYYVYFGTVEEAERNTYLAKETNLIKFVELAEEIKTYDEILIKHADTVKTALTCFRAIKQNPTFFGYTEEYWNELVEIVESAQNDIDAIRINNSRKIVKDTHVLLSLLPSEFSESCIDLLKQIKANLTEMSDEEESLLSLSHYNELNEKYEEYLENQETQEPENPSIQPQDPPQNNNGIIIIIVSIGAFVVVAAAVVFIVIMKKRSKGGR